MARIKGSTAQAGWPRWRRAPEPDANAHPQSQQGPYSGSPYQDDPFAAQPAPAPQRTASHFPHDAFRHLDAERHAPAPPRAAYPPNFERSAQQAHAPGQSLHERLGQHASEAQPRHDHFTRPAAPSHNGWSQPAADPVAFDLAHYAPDRHAGRPHAQPAQDPYAAQPPYELPDPAAADGWNGGGWNSHPQQADPYAEPGFGGPLHPGYAGAQPEGEEHEYIYEDEVEADDGRRGSRMYLVMGTLVTAIAVGGGLAYGYKTLAGRTDGATPIVRADPAPIKTRPADPGGKDIAHTDKKFINRLADTNAKDDAGGSSDADFTGGPRKVTTLVVNRDGSMGAPNPVAPVPQGQNSSQFGSAGSGVPGMLIEGFNSGPARPQLRGSAPSEAQHETPAQPQIQQRAQEQAPQKPEIISRAAPAPEPPRPVPKRSVERETAAEAAAPKQVASAAVRPAATSGNGYVPVLASQKSRLDALKVFADLQQKYSDTLQNGTPDVREVNLGQKGVWHRLMLGPPGSREAAKTVCTQLKAQGYSGCWVTAY